MQHAAYSIQHTADNKEHALGNKQHALESTHYTVHGSILKILHRVSADRIHTSMKKTKSFPLVIISFWNDDNHPIFGSSRALCKAQKMMRNDADGILVCESLPSGRTDMP
jgi:hypothetical protein